MHISIISFSNIELQKSRKDCRSKMNSVKSEGFAGVYRKLLEKKITICLNFSFLFDEALNKGPC